VVNLIIKKWKNKKYNKEKTTAKQCGKGRKYGRS